MTMLSFQETQLPGVEVIERSKVQDHRGFLTRLFCSQQLKGKGFDEGICQINLTRTNKEGSIRGMHFQLSPSAEDKIVTCIRGEVFDVALDLRSSSSSFLKWVGVRLSEDNGRSLLIPKGCAHGFQSLQPNCELIYFHSAPYDKDCEGGISPFDPRIEILWPLNVTDISERDSNHPFLTANFQGVEL